MADTAAVVNPSTEGVIAEVPLMGVEEVDVAVAMPPTPGLRGGRSRRPTVPG